MAHTPNLLITEPHDDERLTSYPTIVSPSVTYAPSFSRPAILSPSFFSPEPSIYDGDTESLRGCDSDPYFFRRLTSFGCGGGSNFSSRAETPLNLGAESPGSVLKPAMTPIRPLTPTTEPWEGSGIAIVHADLPPRPYIWRSSSFQRKMAGNKGRSNDGASCGICDKLPTNPRRMKCCGALFCLDHISNWLASDGCCPSCNNSPFEPALSSLSHTHRLNLPSIDTAPEYDSDYSDSDSDMDDTESAFTNTTAATPICPSDERKTEVLYSTPDSSVNPDNFAMERFISMAILAVVVAGLIKWS